MVQFAHVRSQLFQPSHIADRKTTSQVIASATTVAEALHTELLDQKKATWKYLSVSESVHCYNKCPESTKIKMLGKKVTDDESESRLGSVTSQIQQYGCPMAKTMIN